MELALALVRAEPDAFDPWEKYAELEYANHEAHIALAVLEMQKSMVANAVEAAQRSGLIDNDEYAKYLLDETGMYMPKLNNKQNLK